MFLLLLRPTRYAGYAGYGKQRRLFLDQGYGAAYSGDLPEGQRYFMGQKKAQDFFPESYGGYSAPSEKPSRIIAYIIFNEGLGQFESDAVYNLANRLDPSRLYDTASGWFPHEKSLAAIGLQAQRSIAERIRNVTH